MNRREFLRVGVAGLAAGLIPLTTYNFQTRHLIWIINGNGSRKTDWYQDPNLCPNFARLASEGFVYEESFNNTVSRHEHSWSELITGRPFQPGIPATPSPLDYVRAAYEDRATNYWFLQSGVLLESDGLTVAETRQVQDFKHAIGYADPSKFTLSNPPIPREPYIGDAFGLAMIPDLMRAFKPRMLIFHQVGHDVAHGNGGAPRLETGFSEYAKVCKTTDEQVGRILDFVKNDPYFCRNTTIVIRPEFGRDDELTRYGELHHSTGYYQSHHSAEIWWGPDIKVGVDKTVKNRLDTAPTISKLFNVDAPASTGRIHPEMFKLVVGNLPSYEPYTSKRT